jgi:hypothetical protein
MAYVTAQARQELLDTIAEATDEMGAAISALGDAYELLDERSADALEEQLFRPLQAAYGRAKRTHTDFAGRYDLPKRSFEPVSTASASRDVRGLVDRAAEATREADMILSELQDSLAPVEVGDPEVRAGLAEIRRVLGELEGRARRFVSLFGR